MMFSKTVTAALLLLCAPGVSGFVNQPAAKVSSISLNMSAEDNMKKVVTSFVAAAFLMANTVAVAPAQAFDDFDFGSSQVLAGRGGGRSGGRVGGRSSAPRARAPSSSSSTRVIQRTTIMQPSYGSPMMMAPPMYGYGYNPMGGLGLSLGLNAIQNSGNANRDYRQEGEIQDTKSELERSKMREADMEARLRQMEMQQQQMLMLQQQQAK